MAKVSIDAAALNDYKGKEVVVSDWLTVTQKMIDGFADATNDHQWIHVDVERATRDSPFKAPIAHGFLTLSLLSHFLMFNWLSLYLGSLVGSIFAWSVAAPAMDPFAGLFVVGPCVALAFLGAGLRLLVVRIGRAGRSA